MAALKLARFGGVRIAGIAGGLGGVGLLLCALGLVLDPRRALSGWLSAFAFGVSVALGALIFLMVGYVAGARWPVAVRRQTEAIVGAFPVLGLALVPVLFGAGLLYAWVAPDSDLDPHLAHLLEHKVAYLNLPFFVVRGGFYFLVWSGLAVALRRWSFLSDQGTAIGERPHKRERALSALALPLVGLTLTFASFDWLMSLQPHWYSTAFGVYWFSGGFVASLGLVTLLAFASRRAGLVQDGIGPQHFYALGRLLFAFSVFWAYIAYFQAMLIQMANKPEEVTFYIERTRDGWEAVAWLLFVGRFVIPFVCLLPRAIKHRPAAMAVAGGWILAMHYIDMYWLVAPALGLGPWPSWLDVSALVAIGGSGVAFAAARMHGRPMMPVGDPLLPDAIGYRSPS